MELRLDDLRKKQETIIAEMERAVQKRETIQLKYMNKDKTFSSETHSVTSALSGGTSKKSVTSSSGQATDNSALVLKKITQLKTTLVQTTKNSE